MAVKAAGQAKAAKGNEHVGYPGAGEGYDRGEARNEASTKVQARDEAPTKVSPAAGSLKSLSKLRQQFAGAQGKEVTNGRMLEVEALHKAWQQYADYLRENRNPAVQSLELATLRIINENSFEVSTSNNLEQKFIEQEKRGLSDHLQQVFGNKTISFTIIVEQRVSEEEPEEKPLNKREQFQQIVEQYPLVKELKDRLRLELDY